MKTNHTANRKFRRKFFLTHSRPMALGLLAIVLGLQLGCASQRSIGITHLSSPPVSPLALANLGTIGIVSTSTIPKLSLQRPLTKEQAMSEARGDAARIYASDEKELADKLAGIMRPMRLGNLPGTSIQLAGPNPEAALWGGAVIATVVPISIAGQAIGAIRGVRAKDFEAADAVLSRFSGEVNLQEPLRAEVLRLARQKTAHPIVLVKKPFPDGAEAEFSQMSCVMAGTLAWLPPGQRAVDYLFSQGIQTVLEIQLLYPGLRGEGIINPPMALCLEARARLARVGDDKELYSVSMQYRSVERKFTGWATNDAQPLREELARCTQSVAQTIVNQLSFHAIPVELAHSAGGRTGDVSTRLAPITAGNLVTPPTQ